MRDNKRIVMVPRFAYESIISEASEVWKREVYGLIGGKGKTHYYITKVLPSQTAERKFTEVDTYNYKEAILEDAIKRFGARVIGDFHSHNYYNNERMIVELSDNDKKFLKQYPKLISILVCTEEVDNLHKYWRLRGNVIYGPATSRDSNNKIHKLTTAFVIYYYNAEHNRILKAKLEPTKGLEKLLVN